MSQSTRPTILIAGGGTGGHVFPAIAVAEALQRLADVDVVFVGTDRGIEARVVPARGWTLERLEVEPMKGGGASRALRGALVALKATLHAVGIVRRLKPRAVLSVGGYAAGPATLAAALLGVPVAVLEPNSTVGLANRLLAPFARCAFLAWDEAARSFRAGAVRMYGVPLRAGFSPAAGAATGPALRVLVMGGSQGAAVLNERLPEAFGLLASRGDASRVAVRVLHQAGRDRDKAVRDAYTRAGVEGVEVVAFIDDVARALADADLVVARAGAGTIAEITAVGRPSILVPFPHAADDHQARNAEALARAGAAVCLRQEQADAKRLAAEVDRLLADALERRAMAVAAGARGRPDAARYVARDLLALARVGVREAPRLRNGNGAGPLAPSPGGVPYGPGRWN
jgi:UDP-N-acetylglucosamine--N-acetylmuramyl-(pentapeptide) pyrophosphoryl-undecaprenol N-acetylglucosamine transferase